jgi:hypothetical protein
MQAIRDRPLRKSRRNEASQRVKTSRLRRIRDLFWINDDIYSQGQQDNNDQGGDCEVVHVSTKEEDAPKQDKINEDLKQNCHRHSQDDTDISDSHVLSPCRSSSTTRKVIDFNFGGRLRLKRVHCSPHIYTIHDFLTSKELAVIQDKIRVAHENKMFHQSFVDVVEGVASRKRNREEDERMPTKNTMTPQRTSTFIHFSKLSDSVIASIENRAADLLLLPNHSIEPLQLVRYSKGQYFHDHHDLGALFDDGSVELPKKSAITPPRRIVTILVYLNDLPEGSGGSTQFPLLKNTEAGEDCFSIRPEKNMAVIWCNLLKDGMPDQRVVHRGEIIKDECFKYAMNIWACED